MIRLVLYTNPDKVELAGINSKSVLPATFLREKYVKLDDGEYYQLVKESLKWEVRDRIYRIYSVIRRRGTRIVAK